MGLREDELLFMVIRKMKQLRARGPSPGFWFRHCGAAICDWIKLREAL